MQEALYNRYSSRMMAICARYAYTSFEAEDIFHEAFVKVFKHIENFTGQGSFEGWMKHIFVNTAITFYHRNKKHYHQESEAQIAENASPVEPEIISSLRMDELMALINRLPEGYRMVFNLFAIEGYNHKEIADMLGINEGTSKSQLAKARMLLKKYLQQHSHNNYVASR